MVNRFFILFFFTVYLFAAHGQSTEVATTITGKLSNSSHDKVYLKSDNFSDSTFTDELGNFQYKTTHLTRPHFIYLQIGTRASTGIYLAPGYDLHIQADAIDRNAFVKSLKMTGIGAKTNEFWVEKHPNYLANFSASPLSNPWYDIPVNEFVEKGLNYSGLVSLMRHVQDELFGTSNKEPYAQYFKDYSIKYLKYVSIYHLLKYTGWNDIDVTTTDSLLTKMWGVGLSGMLNRDAFLENYFFREIVEYDYLDHMVRQRKIKGTNGFNEWTYPVEVADAVYTGKVREHVLKKSIGVAINNTFRLDDLNFVEPYIFYLESIDEQEKLLEKKKMKWYKIAQIDAGQLAPDFRLPDMNGNYHQLNTFKGKVVLVTLWASWCGPCKTQMPAVKEIYDKYKTSNMLEVISIATKDEKGKESRAKFIAENNLEWKQLEDEDDFIHNQYQVGTIPRFILIDKEGKFLTPDAPFPTANKKALISMIDEAIAK